MAKYEKEARQKGSNALDAIFDVQPEKSEENEEEEEDDHEEENEDDEDEEEEGWESEEFVEEMVEEDDWVIPKTCEFSKMFWKKWKQQTCLLWKLGSTL